ncbi:MAG: hypothetical protein GTO41_19970 [Burkholderiales bacterium]|nr:hypothetical protein [Burkholderiales bacterium]
MTRVFGWITSFVLAFSCCALNPAACFSQTETQIAAQIAERNNWKAEVRCWDGSRVDLVTPTHVIEVDWSRKHAEAVGQSLYYEIAYEATTGKHLKPAILLLVRDMTAERKYIFRAQAVCAKHDILLIIERVE